MYFTVYTRSILSRVKALFHSKHAIHYAASTAEAQKILDEETIGVLVCSEYPEGESGLQFMARISKAPPLLQPVLMSEGIDEDPMAFAINETGVLKYLKKPFDESQLQQALNSALEIATLKNNYHKALQEMKGMPYFARRARQTTRILLHNANDPTTAAGVTIAVMFGVFFAQRF